jgi:hypothetical protein
MVSIGAWILLLTNISWGMIAYVSHRRSLRSDTEFYIQRQIQTQRSYGFPRTADLLGIYGMHSTYGRLVFSISITDYCKLGNRLLVLSNDANKRFAILILGISFGSNWRMSLSSSSHQSR